MSGNGAMKWVDPNNEGYNENGNSFFLTESSTMLEKDFQTYCM